MATRRAPLANVPNAINSPFRTVAAVSGKRTRTQAGEQRDAVYGQPPSKKQIVETHDDGDENAEPRRRNGVPATPQDKIDEPFGTRPHSTQPTAFEKKLASVREKKPSAAPQRVERSQKQDGTNLESIRQWQKHYRRQFPQFVFYFDSVTDDVRHKAMRSIQHLGAREEKFFSKQVTHVVTTRSIPPERASNSPDEVKFEAVPAKSVQPAAVSQDQRRTTNLLDANLQRRSQQTVVTIQPSVDTRRPASHSSDILTKARALGIKIWALEKLHRVLDTILDAGAEDVVTESRTATTGARTASRNTHDADLEQLLRHEKVNGPTDRDMTVATQDMTTLRGCYIYIHDMDEKSKPVMVRDYPKPISKEEGKWPQFRLTPPGRCPFVEDAAHTKRLQQQGRVSMQAFTDSTQRKTRGGTSAAPSQILGERDANLRRSPRKQAQSIKPDAGKALDPPRPPTSMRQSSTDLVPPLFGSAQANLRGPPRMVGGEPVASGVQHSNVTSAIRSQAISSAAISSTAPGLNMRAGDSKELLSLKRKVFASKGVPLPPNAYVNDMRGAINNDDHGPPPRAAKRKAQETLGVVIEGDEASGQRSKSKVTATKRKKVVEKDTKPGYCENCRDKFDDFDDHITTRKHRKFAMSSENWRDLDALLGLLKRPHKKH